MSHKKTSGDEKCHICGTLITNEFRFALITTTGIYALCDYCKDEQVITAEVDEDAQEAGLQWASDILENL